MANPDYKNESRLTSRQFGGESSQNYFKAITG
jgi:hypothetical protein